MSGQRSGQRALVLATQSRKKVIHLTMMHKCWFHPSVQAPAAGLLIKLLINKLSHASVKYKARVPIPMLI